MNLEPIWRELRNDPHAHAAGVIRRRLRPESPCDLYLGVERPGDLPLLILTVPEDAIADLPHLPSSTGVETVISDGGHGRADVTLRLADPRYTDIFETLRAMADALREHFSAHGPTPLYVVIGRGGPNLVRGMGALRDTCDALGLPYRLFGFDSDMSEVIQFAKKVNTWMKAGGREQVAARLGIEAPVAASAN